MDELKLEFKGENEIPLGKKPPSRRASGYELGRGRSRPRRGVLAEEDDGDHEQQEQSELEEMKAFAAKATKLGFKDAAESATKKAVSMRPGRK